MIEFELGVEDLADTRFAMSPLQETVFSLWALREPGLHADEPPSLAYPCRGAGTLWEQAPEPDATALDALVGAPRAGLLRLLAEPLPTVEMARRLRVTPSAVSQHLKVLHANGLVTRVRDGRLVLYRRSPLGDRLLGEPE